MPLRLSATLIKEFFQYRCERQSRYGMMSGSERLSLSIVKQTEADSPWGAAGKEFEKDIVASLARQQAILTPPPGGDFLADEMTLAFLSRQRMDLLAYQPRLALVRPEEFCQRWSVPPGIELSYGLADLLRAIPEGPRVLFQVIDIKAVQVPASFHKAQVAYYAMLLEQILREAGLPHGVHPLGQIWHPAEGNSLGHPVWTEVPFRLAGYIAQVAEFLRGPLARIGNASVTPEMDDTRFHVYFKCEQCGYLGHCQKAISSDVPPDRRDLSAVPGMSHYSKQALLEMGIGSVAQLAQSEAIATKAGAGWGLKTRGEVLRARAQALADGKPQRFPGRMLHLMPARLDAGLFLLVDQDPVEGRLAFLGCLFRWRGREELTLKAVTRSGAMAEKEVLLEVLGRALGYLAEVDTHNQQGGDDIAHVFVHELSEAMDLQAALGRHLNDVAVLGTLGSLIRMFPPTPPDGDPEYAGHHHLPAAAVRTVFDNLYALPVQVSHDLGRVSQALGLPVAYTPGPEFARPFSSRLNIDRCRDLKAGRISPELVHRDAEARLRALMGLVDWLIRENARAATPFLRLNKEPFRFQATNDSLSEGELGVLEAQELLASRVGELAALTGLALPLEERRTRFRCLGPLTLVGQGPSSRYQGNQELRFVGPREGRYSEIGQGTFGVILTPNDPELLLDPSAWDSLGVEVKSLQPFEDRVEVILEVWRKTWNEGVLKELLASRPAEGWALDLRFSDTNTPRLLEFLRYVGMEDET